WSACEIPAVGCGPPDQKLALGLFGDAQKRQFLLIDMALDAFTHQGAQLPCRNSVELDRRRTAEFLGPCVGLFGRTGREIPAFDLLASDRWPFEMDLSARSVTSEFCLYIAGGIDT